MGALSTSSTVVYNENEENNGTGNGPNQVIAAGTYGNLTVKHKTPVKQLEDNISVKGQLSFDDTELTVTAPAVLTLDGNLVVSQTVFFNDNLKR